MPNVTVDRRLFLNADQDRLVDPDDPAAAFLWATPGTEVSEDETKRLGYKPSGNAKEPEAEKAETVNDEAEKAEANHADTPKGRGRSRREPEGDTAA